MGDHRLFADFSTEELEKEIERRKITKPMPRSNIDWSPVRNVIFHITHSVEVGDIPPKDFETMLFQATMNAVYGNDIWRWWNNKMENR